MIVKPLILYLFASIWSRLRHSPPREIAEREALGAGVLKLLMMRVYSILLNIVYVSNLKARYVLECCSCSSSSKRTAKMTFNWHNVCSITILHHLVIFFNGVNYRYNTLDVSTRPSSGYLFHYFIFETASLPRVFHLQSVVKFFSCWTAFFLEF